MTAPDKPCGYRHSTLPEGCKDAAAKHDFQGFMSRDWTHHRYEEAKDEQLAMALEPEAELTERTD